LKNPSRFCFFLTHFFDPFLQFVAILTAGDFVADLVDAANRPRGVLPDQQVPEAGADVEGVVPAMGLDEDVRVEDVLLTVGHAAAPSE
jgi:hypothetical protein